MALMSNYTVFYDEVSGKWVVRRHGSVKKTADFDTQAKAIDRAKELAKKSGGKVNIKSREGKVRAKVSKGKN